jgi:hypothetical protein
MPTDRMLHHWERDTTETVVLASSATLNLAAAPLKDVVLVRATLTENTTIAVPTGGREGQRVFYFLTASGNSRTITQNASIKGGALANVNAAGAGVVADGSTRVIELIFFNSVWSRIRDLQYS